MCCSPDHVGAPPEWHRELADAPVPVPVRGRGVSPATLAAWVRLLEPRAFIESAAPGSTEGGSGRAVPTAYGPPPRPHYRHPPPSFTELAAWNPARRAERAKRTGGAR